MPVSIAKGLEDDERDRQVLRAVFDEDEGAGVSESEFPAHVRPALWILVHRGDLAATGSTFTITSQGLDLLADLDAANP